MGIFDKWKKKEKMVEEENVSNDASEAENHSANGGRRCTYLVEDTFQLKEDNGIVVVGNVHGTIQVHDAIYIMHPGRGITLAEVSGLENPKKGKVQMAVDEPISIWLKDVKDKSEIAKFSLITSIRPQTVVEVENAIENPYILGLSLEYGRFCKESEYLNLLIFQIAHGHYLTPVYMSQEPEKQEDGRSVMKEGSTMGFLSLKDPEDENKSLLPVFSDWKALSKWENVFDEEHPPRTVILSFQDCVSFVQKNHSGLVINPFGTAPVVLSGDRIKKITDMKGYQMEFGDKKGSSIKEVKANKDTKIAVGLPRETTEVSMLRETLVSYARHAAAIKRVDLLLKVDENKEKAYLCVVDCPQEGQKEIFEGLYQIMRPYANEIKLIDFITYERATFVHQVLQKNPPLYRQDDN